jgi:hypothetical protein
MALSGMLNYPRVPYGWQPIIGIARFRFVKAATKEL